MITSKSSDEGSEIGSERCTTRDKDEIIHVDCVSHVYPDGSCGIHGMCFRIRRGEIVFLCGKNGSGKSTLLEHLNGLLFPSEGTVYVLGRDIGREQRDLWRNVGIVFQRSDDQLFAPTVLDDVMFGPLNLGLSPADAKDAALSALHAVGAEDLVRKVPHYLSGGQKRLVSIAGILAMKPMVIALDEPTSDLDPLHTSIIEDLIVRLRDMYGISVVVATHDLDLASRIADRVCIIGEGRVVAEGDPRDIFYNGDLLTRTGLKEPYVVSVYQEFCRAKGIVGDAYPLTIPDLVQFLSSH